MSSNGTDSTASSLKDATSSGLFNSLRDTSTANNSQNGNTTRALSSTHHLVDISNILRNEVIEAKLLLIKLNDAKLQALRAAHTAQTEQSKNQIKIKELEEKQSHNEIKIKELDQVTF